MPIPKPVMVGELQVVHCGHPTAHRPYYVQGPGITLLATWPLKARATQYARLVQLHGETKALRLMGYRQKAIDTSRREQNAPEPAL